MTALGVVRWWRMARPREFDEEAVLSAAREAFWVGGYEGTSMDDLTAATGLGKGSLYGAFGTKHDVFSRVFDDYCRHIVTIVEGALDGPPETAMDRLATYLRGLARRTADDADRRGCLLAKGTAELANRDPVIAARASDTYIALEAVLARTLSQARRHGDLATVATVPALARTVLATMRGIEALGKAGASRQSLREVADTTIALLAPAQRRATART
ncbi:MAG: TetR/AcrR family transcriptional regulator [Acidimicrobiales bacterium]|nr:TetR/AcrR family transcriptional regulator [Acidimicrobiales bacterium]